MKKEGVNYVFEQNPALAKVGTEKQYEIYLKTIFPESKVQDILWHSTNEDIVGDIKVKNYDEDLKKELYGFYLSDVNFNLYGNKSNPFLINTKKGKELNALEITGFDKEDYQKLKKEGIDTVYAERTNNGKYDYSEIVSFEKDNLYQLGSKKDIQGFKDFLENKNSGSSLEKIVKPISIFIFALGIFLSSKTITGNVIGNFSNLNFVGVILIVLGIVGFFVSNKNIKLK